jgi:ATP-dependent DNA helicase RecQ
LFRSARKGRIWFTVDIAAAAATLGAPRTELVSALNHLEEQGHLTLKVAGLRHGYRFVKRPDAAAKLAHAIHARFQDSEARDIERIGQVVALAELESCTVREVLKYFGETLQGDCGHCDRCLDEERLPMPPVRDAAMATSGLALIKDLIREGHAALASPRQLTRFLCGLPSPSASRAKLTRDPRFGRLSHMRFGTVLEAASANH